MDDDEQFENILDGVEVDDKKVVEKNELDDEEVTELAEAFVAQHTRPKDKDPQPPQPMPELTAFMDTKTLEEASKACSEVETKAQTNEERSTPYTTMSQ